MTARSLLVLTLAMGLRCSALDLKANAGWTSSMLRAQDWLRGYATEDPDQEGLDELKGENPDAFAIVQALLTKKSLGLLNPRHPSASFANGADASAPSGSAAVDMLREASGQPPMSAVSVSASQSHHNWLNWKPRDDDEQMVSNVLGAVAELKNGGSAAAQVASVSSESRAQAVDAEPAISTALEAASPVQPQASMSQENSYVKNIDFSNDMAPSKPSASMSQENSYLKSSSFSASNTATSAQRSNLLTSFSWSEEVPRQSLRKHVDDSQELLQPAAGGALGRFLR